MTAAVATLASDLNVARDVLAAEAAGLQALAAGLDAGFARAWLHAPVRPIAKVALIPPDAAAIELSWTLTPPDASAPATAPQAALARLDARVPGPYVGAAQIYLYDAQGEVLGRLLQNVTPNDAALLLPSRPSP
jgi:hypothetical protein